jgi:hypothetical protein
VSEENVDKVRGFIDAYNRRDFDAAIESFDPDHQVTTFRGESIVRIEYFADWNAALEAAGLSAAS